MIKESGLKIYPYGTEFVLMHVDMLIPLRWPGRGGCESGADGQIGLDHLVPDASVA